MSESRVYGYARVSTKKQNADRQIEALKEFGVEENNIIVDKASGKDTENREGYQYLRNNLLREGDVLVVKDLDRLSRSKKDIEAELRHFRDSGIRVKILSIATTLKDADEVAGKEAAWIIDMINKILIEVIGSIAENERETIRERQREGIALAKARGAYKGRKPITVDKQAFDEEYEKVMSGEHSSVFAMKKLGLKKSTYYRLMQDKKEKKGQWAE